MQTGSEMGSQRFCLRWNNHQTNLLSVFDQLLHDEAFVDVTLAVEGQFLRAHKMVLSACSPYFQALFVGHPDKHPIVILKDVPYSDMRSLLDFMYRGEVSVDQDRLTAFLKVAESLRIKGLTEVNEERCDLPSIANSLLNQTFTPPPPPPPPSLHRLQMPAAPAGQTKPVRPPPNPMLNSALTAPKRKRGRPRKLSGSSPNPPPISHPDVDHDEQKPPVSGAPLENHLGVQFSPVSVQQQPHAPQGNSLPLPQEIPVAFRSCLPSAGHPPGVSPQCNNTSAPPSSNPPTSSIEESFSPKIEDEDDDCEDLSKMEDGEDDGGLDEEEPPDPTHPTPKSEDPKPSTSGQDSLASFQSSTQSDGERFSSSGIDMLRLVPKSELMNFSAKADVESDDNDSLVVDSVGDAENNNDSGGFGGDEDNKMDFAEPSPRPVPTKRRVRRRTASSADPAEALTEMSVRGLNLFRYASITEGIYKCMECAKADVLKTFKNKYSFQRHAFLYHEGHQRKVFPCPVCAKEFSRPDKMKNHMKMVHDCFIPKECMFPAVGFYLPP